MTTTDSGARRSVLAAPLDPFTYRTLAYLALAAPIGLAYTVLLSAGLGVTLGFSVTPLGPVAAVATLLAVVALAFVDAHLTGGLLGVDVHPELPDADDGAVAFLKSLALGRPTWTGVAFLCYRAVLGLVASVVLVTGVTTTAALLAAPLTYGDPNVVYAPGGTVVDTLGESLLVAAAGVVVGVVTLYATNLLGRVSAHVATGLFGVDPADGDGDADAA